MAMIERLLLRPMKTSWEPALSSLRERWCSAGPTAAMLGTLPARWLTLDIMREGWRDGENTTFCCWGLDCPLTHLVLIRKYSFCEFYFLMSLYPAEAAPCAIFFWKCCPFAWQIFWSLRAKPPRLLRDQMALQAYLHFTSYHNCPFTSLPPPIVGKLGWLLQTHIYFPSLDFSATEQKYLSKHFIISPLLPSKMNKGEWEKWKRSVLFLVFLSSLEKKKVNWINEERILWWVYSQRLFLNLIKFF